MVSIRNVCQVRRTYLHVEAIRVNSFFIHALDRNVENRRSEKKTFKFKFKQKDSKLKKFRVIGSYIIQTRER